MAALFARCALLALFVAAAGAHAQLLPPRFSAQTQGPITAKSPERVSLTLYVSGSNPMQYQWNKDGVPIPGATDFTFAIENSTPADSGRYQATARNEVGAVSSTPVEVTVKELRITSAITDQSASPGGSATFTVGVTSTDPVRYEWHHSASGGLVAGATGSSLTLSNLARDSGGYVTVYVSNDYFREGSHAQLIVNAPPVVTIPVPTRSAVSGTRVNLNAGITGLEPFTYQWFKDGLPIAGATSAGLQFASVERADTGDYAVEARNPYGVATSPPGRLTVFNLAIVGALTKVYDGAPLTVSATTDPAGLAVTMRYSSANGFAMGAPVNVGTYAVAAVVQDGIYSGIVQAALRITPTPVAVTVHGLHQIYDGTPRIVRVSVATGAIVWPQYEGAGVPLDAGAYPVTLLTDDGNIRASLPQDLMMVVEKAPQAIMFDALPATLATGTPFSVRATATSGLPVALGVVSGNATLDGTNLTLNDTEPVVIRATQPGERNHHPASEEIALSAAQQTQTIGFAPLADRMLSTAPIALSASASSGLPVTFAVGGGPATVTGSTLTFTGYEGVVIIRATQVGNSSYNAAASVVRSFAVLTAERPVITAPLASRTVSMGQDVDFTVGATSPGPLTYIWMKDGVPARFSRPMGGNWSFRNVNQFNAGRYSVAIFNGSSCVITEAAILTIQAAPNPDAIRPIVTSITPSQEIRVGDSFQLTVATDYRYPALYRWFKDGLPIPGAFEATYRGPRAIGSEDRMLPALAGTYHALAFNAAGSATSPPCTITVAPGYDNLRRPLITGYTPSTWTTTGGTASLSVTALGEGLTYRWFKGSGVIAGATGATLTFTNAQPAVAGTYSVHVQSPLELSTSIYQMFVAVLTGNERGAPFGEMGGPSGPGGPTGVAPTIGAQPLGGTFEFGSRVVLSVTADGTLPLTYEWRREGAAIPTATGSTLVFPAIQPGDAGSYGVVVRNGFGSTTSGAVPVQVSAEPPSTLPRPPAITTPPSAQTVIEGGTVIFTVNVTGSQPLSFQWRHNGVPLSDGHDQSLILPNVRSNQAGNYEVTIVNPYGAVTSVPVALTVTPATPVTPPPAGTWQEQNIGGAIPAGSVAVTGETVSVRGGGADIWDVSDSFFFRYQALSGDGAIIARINSLQDTHAWAKAGVMIRESLAPGARNAIALVTPQFVASLQHRSLPNGTTQLAGSQWVWAPRWLRLARAGNSFTAHHSSDGTNWTLINSVQLEMSVNVFAGLAVTSHFNGTPTTVEFDQVNFAGSAPPPPPPTSLPALSAPSSLSATIMSATALTLNWTDNTSTETSFDLQRSTDNANFVSVALLGANVITFASTGLSPSTLYYFRVRAMQGSTSSEFSNVVSATMPASVTPPPPPTGTWQTLDVGGVAASGSAAETDGTVTLRGSGADIWDTGDEFRYRYIAWSGDGEIIARITSLTDTHAWAKTGLMFREDLTASARHVFMCLSSGNGTALQSRVVAGGGSDSISGSRSATPRWLRLARAGSTFTGYESEDGVNWTRVSAVTLALPAAIHLGLAVTSHTDGVLCTATFTQVTLAGGASPPVSIPSAPAAPSSLTGTATSTSAIGLSWADHSSNETGFEIERSLDNVSFAASGTVASNATSATVAGLNAATPYFFRVRAITGSSASVFSATVAVTTFAPTPPTGSTGTWETLDIGAVAATGSATESGGTVTLAGSGEDIWNGSDEFRFRYLNLTGDGQIIARLTALTNTHSWAKAGVMFRESLTGPSRHLFMCISAAQGSSFQRRSLTGGGSDSTVGSLASTLPAWVRLVRSGSLFTAYDSIDGSSWNQVGSVTINLPATLFVGVAVTSHNDGVLCTATLGSVSVTGGATPPTPPPTTSPPPAAALLAPSGLTATPVSSSQVNLSWADNSPDESEFILERSIDNVLFAPLPPVAAGQTTHSDSGRTAGTTYYYRIRAANSRALSPYSNTAMVTTLAAPVGPTMTWSHSDVGATAVTGSMDAIDNTITLRGSGADVWDGVDAFRFLYRVINGDCVVETKVTSITNTHPWAKGGVMIRESLEPNARNVFLFLTPLNGIGLQLREDRTVPRTTFQAGPWGAMPPYWVRLVRTGGEIVSAVSPDGVTWTQLARYPFAATAPLYVGFAVTSHDNSQVATAVFTDPFIQ